MITDVDVNRLLAVRTAERSVLSLYLRVPADPGELRELPARAHGLITLAAASGRGTGAGSSSGGPWPVGPSPGRAGPVGPSPGRAGPVGPLPGRAGPVGPLPGAAGPVGPLPGAAGIDGAGWPARAEQQVRTILEVRGRDWLGHTAALFVGGEAGLSEAFALPCLLPDRAVLAARPHVRPLLVAEQRCPAHYVAIVDRRHAWLFRVAGDQIEVAAAEHADPADEVRSSGFGGWYGLDSHNVNERVIELAHQHFQAAAALIGSVLGRGTEPLVIGGHVETIGQFAGLLPAPVRDRMAGSFVVDPHTMTPARVRALARGVIAGWVGMHEQRRVLELRASEGQHDPLVVTGLGRCLDAVNARAVDLLVVPVGGVIDGYVCESCGALGTAVTSCPDGLAECRWVPDLLEEMVTRTLDEGGRTEALVDPPGDVAARLRFPVAAVRAS